MPNYFWGFFGLLIMLAILIVMVRVAGTRLRAAKSLLSKLHYIIPEGFDVMTKQADAVLMQGINMSLDLRVANVPSDVAFKVYLLDMLAALELPYDGLEMPEGAAFPGWNALSQQEELPNLFVLYKQIEEDWVYVLMASDAENYTSGTVAARKLADSVVFTD